MPLMNHTRWVGATMATGLAALALSVLAAAPAWAQAATGAGAAAPAHGAEAKLVPAPMPDLKLPKVNELRLAVPRTVQAASSLLGYGRQRLALVVGIGMLGSRQVLDSATRDTQAVATALRAGGFVVMVREDANGTDLRAALREYRERLQPGGVGFVYVTGLGAQVDGQNLLLPRNTRLDASTSAAEVAAQVKASGVPLQEVVDALMSTSDSARLLVVDAAYTHPALAKLPKPGLAEQRLPPGMLALFGYALAATQEVPASAALPLPLPTDPREIASTRFARVLVGMLVTPRVSGNDALRHTHRALIDGAPGQPQPWLGGQSDNSDDLAEASLLDGLFPRTPEDLAREALKQITRAALRDGGGGVAAASTAPAVGPDLTAAKPGAPRLPPSGIKTISSASGTLGSATTVAGTAASVAAGAATVVATTQALAAVSATTTAATSATAAVSGAGSLAGSVVGATSRMLSSSTGEQPARQAVQQLVARTPVSSAVAAASTTGVLATAALQPAAASAHSTAGNALDGRTQRSTQGGERPVYNPRTNRFGYSEGDTFTYQVMDMWKEEVTSTFTTAIEEVLGDGQLLANGQTVQMDAQGRVKSQRKPDGSVSRFEPQQDLWWSNPKPGQTREVTFKELFERQGADRGQVSFEGSSSVGKLRKIETPAGPFDAMPIETTGYFNGKLANGLERSGQFTRTVWYSPQLGHPVRIDIIDTDRMGKLLVRERVELMHAQRAPQP